MPINEAKQAFEEAKKTALEWLHKEVSSLRSGRVKPSNIEDIMVEHYGSRNPLKGLASISSLDARTLLVSPWDKSAVPAIQKALTEAQLGVMPTVDGQVIRLSFPSLTQEVREQTLKTLNKKGEEGKVRLRMGRDEAIKILKKDKEDNKITEDDFYSSKEELDKLIEKANQEVADILAKKETDITSL